MPRIDLTWVDEALHERVHREGSYSSANDVSFDCKHLRVLVGVDSPEVRVGWVDAELAPVVRACWRAGATVTFACEGGTPDTVWAELDFDEAEHLIAFLDAALPYDETPGSAYDRAVGDGAQAPENRERRWHVRTYFFPRFDGASSSHGLGFTLRIPPPDLPTLRSVHPKPIRTPSQRSRSRRKDASARWVREFDLGAAIARLPEEERPGGGAAAFDRLLMAQSEQDLRRVRRMLPD